MNEVILATKEDKKDFVNILSEAFLDDPQLRWMLDGKKNGFEKRLKILFSYLFETTLCDGEIYFTKNKKAVAAWQTPPKFNFSFRIIPEAIKFILGFGIFRVIKIIQMEKIFSKLRDNQNTYYLFLLGVANSERGKGLSSILIDYQIEKSKQNQYSIFLETSTNKNITIYQKKGFKVFHEHNLDAETKISSMKYEKK